MPESTEYGESTEFPSLIDDVAFLAELEKFEADSLAAKVTRPVHARRPVTPARLDPMTALAPPREPVIPRDVNRWHLHPPPGVEPESTVRRRRPSKAPVLLPILIGLCAGAAVSAYVFSERLAQILALLAP